MKRPSARPLPIGWVRRPGREFHLHDVYRYEERLSGLHPNNNRVRAKIRQVMQRLRDEGLIEFLGDGHYRALG